MLKPEKQPGLHRDRTGMMLGRGCDRDDPGLEGGLAMRYVLSFVAVVTLGLAVGLGAHPGAVAQEATPVVTQGEMGEGITYEQIDFGTVDVLPPAPATIGFYHARLEPGVSIPIGAEDPGLGPHLVESGTMTVRNFTEDIIIHRTDGGQEVVPAGVEASLGTGDRFVWEPYVGGEIANDGDEPLIYYTVNIFPVGAATPDAGEMAATPAM